MILREIFASLLLALLLLLALPASAEPLYKVTASVVENVGSYTDSASISSSGHIALYEHDRFRQLDLHGGIMHERAAGAYAVAFGKANDLYVVTSTSGESLDGAAYETGPSGLLRIDLTTGEVIAATALPVHADFIRIREDGIIYVISERVSELDFLQLSGDLTQVIGAWTLEHYVELNDVAIDPLNPSHLWLGGSTRSTDFVSTDGTSATEDFEPHPVLMQVDNLNQTLLYSSVLTNQPGSSVNALLATADAIHFAGMTWSETLPTTRDALQREHGGFTDGMYGKISRTGELQHLSYLGGAHQDEIGAIATDSAGRLILAGVAESGNPLVSDAPFPFTVHWKSMPFLAVLSSDLSSMEHLSYIDLFDDPGFGELRASALTVGEADRLYLVIESRSSFVPDSVTAIRLEHEGLWLEGGSALPISYTGDAYAVQLRAHGGNGDYTYELVRGELPEGVQFTSDGELSGTTTQLTYVRHQAHKGGASLMFKVTDGEGRVAWVSKRLVVAAPLTVTVAEEFRYTNPRALVLAKLRVEGGYGSYSAEILQAPEGMELDQSTTFGNSFSVSGDAPHEGRYDIRVRVKDEAGAEQEVSTELIVTYDENRGGGSLFWLCLTLLSYSVLRAAPVWSRRMNGM